MPITKPIALAVILLTAACASTPAGRGSQEIAKKPLRGGIAEFQVTSYDGRDLKGRVLIGASIDPLVIDGRLFEVFDVDVEKVRACGKKELLEYLAWEAFPPPPRPDELVTLHKGYWYGGNVHFPLFFGKETTGPGPDCLEAELVVWNNDRRVAARLPIRVVRTDKPPAPLGSGTEAPKLPP